MGTLLGLALTGSVLSPAAMAEGQVQLQCAGTLLETRGLAERERQTARLHASLSLDAEAGTADQALEQLQQRLADVRSALKSLAAVELRVSSPSTWQRPQERGQGTMVQANLQVTATLAPSQLQGLIRSVGSLPGVRLMPVGTEADRREDSEVRQMLLQQAYREAREQAQQLATLFGGRRLTPLEIRIDSQDMPVMGYRTMAAAAPPPFNPDELNKPRQQVVLQGRFCAQ